MNFDHAFGLIVSAEGDYSDDKNDPGGKTRFGITESVARHHGYTGDMKQLPIEKAKEIYKQSYWDECRCDEIPWPLSLFVFDCAVNQGAFIAKKLLQQTLGTTQDGVLGTVTITLAKRATAWHAAKFMALRAQRYTQTKGYDTFGMGWMTRIFQITLES